MDEAWGSFFAAQVGGAATLLGLLFVGVSLNLSQILKAQGLADRALLALVLLLMVMILALLFLIPGIGALALGIVITGLGMATLAGGAAVELGQRRQGDARSRLTRLGNMLLLGGTCAAYVVGGVLLLFGSLEGTYWTAAAMVLATVKATVDAWVLLVEINR